MKNSLLTDRLFFVHHIGYKGNLTYDKMGDKKDVQSKKSAES